MNTDKDGRFTVVWKNEKVEGTYTVNAYYCGSNKIVATTFTDDNKEKIRKIVIVVFNIRLRDLCWIQRLKCMGLL